MQIDAVTVKAQLESLLAYLVTEQSTNLLHAFVVFMQSVLLVYFMAMVMYEQAFQR